MKSIFDRIIVQANCPICGARIGAHDVQIRTIKLFACGCGTVIDADMPSIETQAIICLVGESDAAPARSPSEPA
jgi:transposase